MVILLGNTKVPEKQISACLNEGLDKIAGNRFNPFMGQVFVDYAETLRQRDVNQRTLEEIINTVANQVPRIPGGTRPTVESMKREHEVVRNALVKGMQKLLRLETRGNEDKIKASMIEAQKQDQEAVDKRARRGIPSTSRRSIEVFDMDDRSKEPQIFHGCKYFRQVKQLLMVRRFLEIRNSTTQCLPELWIGQESKSTDQRCTRWWSIVESRGEIGSSVTQIDAVNAFGRPYYVVVAVYDGLGVWPLPVDVPTQDGLLCCRDSTCETMHEHLVKKFGPRITLGWIQKTSPKSASESPLDQDYFPNRTNYIYVEREIVCMPDQPMEVE